MMLIVIIRSPMVTAMLQSVRAPTFRPFLRPYRKVYDATSGMVEVVEGQA